MDMTFTYRDLDKSRDSLALLASLDFSPMDAKLAYRIGKNWSQVQTELKDFDKKKIDIIGLDHGVGHPITFWSSPWLAVVG